MMMSILYSYGVAIATPLNQLFYDINFDTVQSTLFSVLIRL
ncbi:hypothetical protein [Dolichospermum flos-aquae]|nr:hypothetical protein [Dolichospermum flos-aquae]